MENLNILLSLSLDSGVNSLCKKAEQHSKCPLARLFAGFGLGPTNNDELVRNMFVPNPKRIAE